jgi:serine/threonine protein kinase
MPAPATARHFVSLVRKSGLLSDEVLAQLDDRTDLPADPAECADSLVRERLLTPFQAHQLLSGRFRGLVLGPYRMLRPIGRGGMGVVYLAEHTDLHRPVAIKMLARDRARQKLAVERLYREARAAAALDHPNIVRIYDVTRAAGVHFLVMEFIDGTDLQALLEVGGPLSHTRAAEYVAQAAAGLHHAHRKGIVHRDIKPANLMLAADGTVKVLDMGLARSLASARDALTAQAAEGMVGGTADFLSPEQAANAPLDARSDVYNLGGTLYSLLTGRPPFEGTTAEKLAQHQVSPPPDPCRLNPAVPPGLAEIVARMLAKRPEDRFQSAQEATDALAPWRSAAAPADPTRAPTAMNTVHLETGVVVSNGWRIRVPSDSTGSGEPAPAQRDRWGWVVAVGVIALALIGLAAAVGGRHAPAGPSQAEPGPAEPAPAPLAEMPVFALDLSHVQPFRLMFRNSEPDDPAWPEKVPSRLHMFCWKRESVAEFWGVVADGRPAVGVANLNDELSSQIVFRLEDLPQLKPARRYKLRVEYRTTNDARGMLYVRNPRGGGEYPSIGEGALSGTDGRWRTLDVPFHQPEDRQLDAIIDNRTVGVENVIEVRAVEVYDADPGR